MKENLEGDNVKCKGKGKKTSAQKKDSSAKGNAATPTTPPNTVEEDRIPPSWGSNLVNVKCAPDVTATSCPGPKDTLQDNNDVFDLEANLENVDQFVEEFSQGVIKSKLQIEPREFVPQSSVSQPQIKPREDQLETLEESEETEDDNEEVTEKNTERAEAIAEDAHLVEHFKELNQPEAEQKVNAGRVDVRTTSPALAGIPMTTPRPSPSPKRRKKVEKYRQESPVERESFGYAVEEETDDEAEDSLTEQVYEEWANRLRRLEWECEQQLTDIKAQRDQGGGRRFPDQ